MYLDEKVTNINASTRCAQTAAIASSVGEIQYFTLLENRCTPALKSLIQSLFDNIDDALFELAGRAVQNTVQNMYFEAMREIRIKRSTLEKNFFDELRAHFALLQAGPGSPPVLSQWVSGADSLALVAPEELEEQVAAEAMIAKAGSQFSTEIATMNRYIEVLLAAKNGEQTLNPLTPQTICRVFIKCCGDLEVEIKAKLVLFKLFERYVLAELAPVYKMACSMLIAAAKTYRLEPVDPLNKSPHRDVNNNSPATSHALHSTQHRNQNVSAQAGDSQTQSLFSDLQSMMHQLPSPAYLSSPMAGSSSGLLPPGQGRPISREKLFDLLLLIQRNSEKQWQQQSLAPTSLDIVPLLDQVIAGSNPSAAMSMGQLDDDAINLVAMLFQYILDDRNLAAAIKGLICRLQIPIIKVAMLDKTFFSKVGHPARKLLNEIAYAGISWSEKSDFASDPLYSKVSEVVSQLVEDSSIEQFHQALVDFVAFIETVDRRSQLVEQRIINVEDGKAKTEHARAVVQSLLAEKMAGRKLQPTVEKLLLEPWRNVLLLRYLKREQEPELWQQALQSLDDLLWSVGAISSDSSRRRLIALIPPLLQQLRIGLMAIAYDQFEMNQLLVELDNIHLAQLEKPLDRGELEYQRPPTQPRLDDLQMGDDPLQPSLEQLDAQLDVQLADFGALADFPLTTVPEPVEPLLAAAADEQPVLAEQQTASVDPSILRAVDNLATGSWVEVHQQDGKKFRCRLAAIIRGTEKYIFVNRAGMKVAEHYRSALIEAIGRGEMSLLDEGLLFDRALESVIGSLRASSNASN